MPFNCLNYTLLLLHLFITHLVIDFLLVNIYFFQEIILSLNRAALKFENFIVMGDFNIDVNASGPRKDNLDEFCNLFDLTNLVREVTCWTNNHRSTIDLILTNRPDSFQKTSKGTITIASLPFSSRIIESWILRWYTIGIIRILINFFFWMI